MCAEVERITVRLQHAQGATNALNHQALAGFSIADTVVTRQGVYLWLTTEWPSRNLIQGVDWEAYRTSQVSRSSQPRAEWNRVDRLDWDSTGRTRAVVDRDARPTNRNQWRDDQFGRSAVNRLPPSDSELDRLADQSTFYMLRQGRSISTLTANPKFEIPGDPTAKISEKELWMVATADDDVGHFNSLYQMLQVREGNQNYSLGELSTTFVKKMYDFAVSSIVSALPIGEMGKALTEYLAGILGDEAFNKSLERFDDPVQVIDQSSPQRLLGARFGLEQRRDNDQQKALRVLARVIGLATFVTLPVLAPFVNWACERGFNLHQMRNQLSNLQ